MLIQTLLLRILLLVLILLLLRIALRYTTATIFYIICLKLNRYQQVINAVTFKPIFLKTQINVSLQILHENTNYSFNYQRYWHNVRIKKI